MNKMPSCNPKESMAPRKDRDWRTMSIVEIAAENPSVFDYVQQWEGRTLKAESKLERLKTIRKSPHKKRKFWERRGSMIYENDPRPGESRHVATCFDLQKAAEDATVIANAPVFITAVQDGLKTLEEHITDLMDGRGINLNKLEELVVTFEEALDSIGTAEGEEEGRYA